MPPSAFNASPALAFPEKSRALDGEVRDSIASSSSSFDWAEDVEQEFYCGDDSDDGRGDGAGSSKVDRAYSSGIRSFRGSGFSLTAISEEPEDEDEDEEDKEDSTTTDSTDTRNLLDTNRMFTSSHPTTNHRRYRVASVPSLWAIKEDDEDSDDESLSDARRTVSTFDPFCSSLTCVAAADAKEREPAVDDSDSGWVWVDAEEARKAPVSSTDARPHRLRFRVVSWFKALSG
ncbi:hypothetical protein GSI_03145 [Ganoderma sinense ZZ0214-1]|uniref:Uncharacterized protein n=1 Tax=Ganoderma sinense ZZ0214-1 TaxID=1077348 RepID=A0A2G8SKT7_9APHY|nr:hypothetical protein GSI_03145 [Ganoderma sinense ZZ0214-1]